MVLAIARSIIQQVLDANATKTIGQLDFTATVPVHIALRVKHGYPTNKNGFPKDERDGCQSWTTRGEDKEDI